MKNKVINFRIGQIIFYIITAVIVLLLFAERTSPLYSLLMGDYAKNEASHAMLVGKYWFQGNIPYRDLFVSAYPMYLLIQAVGWLIGGRDGIFFLEIISLSVLLLYSSRLLELRIKKKHVLFFVPLLLLIPYAALCCGGNSAIEWCLVPVTIGLYHIYQSFSCGFTNLRIIKIGLCCGICLMIHPYGVAPLFGAAVYCFFAHHNYKKRIIGLLFLVAPTVLFIVYFAAYGCVFDFLHAVWTIPIKELHNSVIGPIEMIHKAIKCLLFAPLFFCGIRNVRKHDNSYGSVQISIAIIASIILLCCNNGWHFFLAAIPALLLAMGEIASSRQVWIGVTIAFYCSLCSIPLRDYVTFLSEGTLDVVWEWYEDLLIFQADDSDFHMTMIDTDSSYLLAINEKPSYRYFCDQTTIMENISTAVSEWEAYMASLGEEDIVVTSDHTWQGREIDNFSQVQVYLKTECISVYIYTGAEI